MVAESAPDASAFVGVRDGSATASTLAQNVEVVGLDSPHAALTPIPAVVAPAEQRQFSDAEIAQLREILKAQSEAPAPSNVTPIK